MTSVYIASGWFNQQQLQRVLYVENILRIKRVDYFSPRLHQTTTHPEFSPLWREEVFQMNINQIRRRDVMIAIYDEQDPGTMMEIGYAYAIGKPIILITFKHQPINLMLVESPRAIIPHTDLLGLDLSRIPNREYTGVTI